MSKFYCERSELNFKIIKRFTFSRFIRCYNFWVQGGNANNYPTLKGDGTSNRVFAYKYSHRGEVSLTQIVKKKTAASFSSSSCSHFDEVLIQFENKVKDLSLAAATAKLLSLFHYSCLAGK